MTIRFVSVDGPSPEAEEAAFRQIRAFNLEQTRFEGPIGAFCVLIHDDAGQTIGGVWTRIHFNWMFVSLLFVPEHLRGAGIGRELMARVETRARDHGCIGIHLDTFSFQAPDFYRKLGFEEFGVIENYPDAASRHFLLKRLQTE